MKKITMLLLTVLAVIILGVAPVAAANQSSTASWAEHRAIVCVRTQDKGETLQAQSADGLTWEPLMDVSGSTTGGVLTTQGTDQAELMLVKSDTLTTEEIIAAAQARSDVIFAEPDTIGTLGDDLDTQAADTSQIVTQSTADYSRYQWGLKNTGLYSKGTAGVDIGNTSGLTGSKNTVIAVMDTGIDYTHEELADQMVDLRAYPSLIADTKCSQYGYNAVDGEPTDDPFDYAVDSTHGTHCAGIIGAAANGSGTAGVMKNVSLMSVRVFGKSTIYYQLSDILRAYSWLYTAKQAGVNVKAVNCSFNSTGMSKSQELAIQKDGEAGILTIMASGNNSYNTDTNQNSDAANVITSAYKVTVDSLETQEQPSSFTNYGVRSTDVFAPGSDVLSTVGELCARFNAFTAALDPSRILTYNGFEDNGGTAATEQDVNPLTFCVYDEAAADHCGAPATVSGANAFIGDKALSVARPAEGDTVTLITKPMKLTPDTSRKLYLSASVRSDNTVAINSKDILSLGYRKADGTFTGDGTSEDLLSRQLSWKTDYVTVPTDGTVDFDHFQLKMTIHFTDAYSKSITIDSFGMGYGLEKYAVYSGTSMATPMTCGEAGLLASLYPNESAAQISARITGGTTDDAKIADMCKSGGFINVAKAASDPNPAVQAVTLNGRTATLTGYFFGSKGSVTVGDAAATVTDWSDTSITITLPDGVTGEQPFVVTDAAGQSGRMFENAGNPANAYTDLAVPTDSHFDNLYGMSMDAIGGSIYMLAVGSDSSDTLWRYDIAGNQWHYMDAVKIGTETLKGKSSNLCACRGKLYFTYANYLVSWDAASNTWAAKAMGETLPLNGRLVNDGGRLLLVGGMDSSGQRVDSILEFDTDAGTVTTAGKLPKAMSLWYVNASEGTVMMAVAEDDGAAVNVTTYVSTDLTHWLSYTQDIGDTGQSLDFVTASTKSGMILAGLVGTSDGGYHDTWTFDKTTGNWTAADATLNVTKAFNTEPCAAGGRFYVFGMDLQAPGLDFLRSTAITSPEPTASVTYESHGRNYGWDQGWVYSDKTAGTTGQALRMEALRAKVVDETGSPIDGLGITYQAHVQDIGWMDWQSDGDIAGTTGRSLRMEAVKMKLTGSAADQYTLTYRVHVQNMGWTDWVAAGQEAGTTGKALRAEAVEIRITKK